LSTEASAVLVPEEEGADKASATPGTRESIKKSKGSVVTGIPDSRRGDPNVATGATSDPPRRVYEDRAAVEKIVNNPIITPVLHLYDGTNIAIATVTEGFPDCQWHARVSE
jgi:hypothetical protein